MANNPVIGIAVCPFCGADHAVLYRVRKARAFAAAG